MIPCISQACTLPQSFSDDLSACAGAGATHVEVWLTKLEQHLATHSVESTLAMIAQHRIQFAAASYHGGLLISQGEARRMAFHHFRQRLDLCQTFAIPVLVLAADFACEPVEIDHARAAVSLTEAALWAAGFGVRLALEFRGTDCFCSCLDTALALVEAGDEPNLGVCLDAFHFMKGPSKESDLGRLSAANLAHVQFSDVAGVQRERMTDADRVLPGEGDFPFELIVQRLKAIGYSGAVSLETMNPTLWKAKPTQVIELGLTALRRVLV